MNLKEAHSSFDKALKLREKEQFKEAIQILETILPVFEQYGHWEKYIESLNYLGDLNNFISEVEKSTFFLEKALKEGNLKLKENHPLIARTYFSLGNAYYSDSKINNAIDCYQKSLEIIMKNENENSIETVRIYGNLGLCWKEKGNTKKALKYMKKVLYFFSQKESFNPYYVSMTYNNLGIILKDECDYDNALRHLQKALEICNTYEVGNKYLKANILNNFGHVYWHIGNDLNTALKYHFRSLDVRKILFGENHRDVALSYNNLAVSYSEMKIYDKAIEYHLKAVPIQIKYDSYYSLAQSYHNIAACYEALGNLNLALDYHQKGLDLVEKNFGEQNSHIITAYDMLGLHFHKFRKNHKKALDCYQKSIEYNLEDVKHIATCLQEKNNIIEKVLDIRGFLKAFELKALCLYEYYQKTSNLKFLFNSYIYYYIFCQLIDNVRNSYKSEESKLIRSQKSHAVYSQAIQVALELGDLYKRCEKIGVIEKACKKSDASLFQISFPNTCREWQHQAWNFAESNKSLLLFNKLKESKAKLNAQIPQELLEKELDLRLEITYLDKRIKEEKYKGATTRNEEKILQWQSQYLDYQQAYDELILLFETEYPQYYQLKYDLQTTSVSNVQKRLGETSALVEYAIGEKQAYIFVITKNNYTVHSFEKTNDFEKLVEEVCRLVKQSNPNPRQFAAKSHQLYQTIFAPISEQIEVHKQLIIIPDGILSKLPFEVLLTKPSESNVSYADLKYLLQKHTIQYHFSATLWAKSSEFHSNSDVSTEGFFGFAPVYASKAETSPNVSPPHQAQTLQIEEDLKINTSNLANRNQRQELQSAEGVLRSLKVGNTTFKELQYSENEVMKVTQLFENKGHKNLTCLHSHATLQQLENHIPNFQYVLLSTHADYDDQRPDLTGIICSPNIEEKASVEAESVLDEFDLTDKYVLYMPDVYHLRLNADLVVLSCCESGIGKMAKGEGMMALNRGFLFAGAKNVVYTLFKVYDKQSSKLTFSLFKGIVEKKLPYNEALRQAKLQLIQKGYLPVHWAGFVLIGE